MGYWLKCLALLMTILVCACSSSEESSDSSAKVHILANCYLDNAYPASGEIYLIADGVYEAIVPDGFNPENIDFSKDGRMIAYSKGEDEASEIYVMDMVSRKETRITQNGFIDYNPNLSPDKADIVYWSQRDGKTSLFISGTDGSNERCITCSYDAWTYDPEWSNDGSMISFNYDTAKTGCKAVIYAGILNPDRAGFDDIFPLSNTAGAYVEVDPAWSSDDTKIAFSTYEGPGCWFNEGLQADNLTHWKIKTVNVDKKGRQGSGLTTVWQSPGTHVNWLPIWADEDRSLLVIHSVIDASPHTPFGTTSHLAFIDVRTSAEAKIEGTNGCYWCDYLKVY